ncbi:MAG: helix-hairpin-helix domain-containing protein [bacterium]
MNRFLARSVASLATTAVLLTALPSFAASTPSQPAPTAKAALVDLNHASVADLEALPGIGPSRAEAIVKYRTEKGGFSTAAEIAEIKGISDNLVKRLETMVTVTPVKK